MGLVLAVATSLVALIAATVCFLRSRRGTRVRAVRGPAGYQVASVTVRGRYHPDVVEVERDVPTRLHFFRDEDDQCSERVVFAGIGVDRRLPPFERTTIEFVPREAGAFLFTCQRGMYRGTLVVKPAGETARSPRHATPKPARSLRRGLARWVSRPGRLTSAAPARNGPSDGRE